jgi:hypothetical protein
MRPVVTGALADHLSSYDLGRSECGSFPELFHATSSDVE